MTDDYYVAHPSPEPDPLINNPYLNREKCLLCQRDRTDDDKSDSEGERGKRRERGERSRESDRDMSRERDGTGAGREAGDMSK